jgi:hypothetical protein
MSVMLGFIHPNTVSTGFMHSVLGVVAEQRIEGVLFERGGPAELGQARDRLVHKFLQTTGEHLWFVDTDIIFKTGAIGKLLSHDKPVVSANYSLVHEIPATFDWETRECAYHWTDGGGMRHHDHGQHGTAPGKVDACGAGCLLIKRDVLEDMGEPWFGEEYPGFGEDITFCRRLTELNIPLYYDFDLKVLHQKTVWV